MLVKNFALLLIIAALIGCGGGGGEDESSSQQPASSTVQTPSTGSDDETSVETPGDSDDDSDDTGTITVPEDTTTPDDPVDEAGDDEEVVTTPVTPEEPTDPDDGVEPEDPTDPDDGAEPEEPTDPDDGDTPEDPEEPEISVVDAFFSGNSEVWGLANSAIVGFSYKNITEVEYKPCEAMTNSLCAAYDGNVPVLSNLVSQSEDPFLISVYDLDVVDYEDQSFPGKQLYGANLEIIGYIYNNLQIYVTAFSSQQIEKIKVIIDFQAPNGLITTSSFTLAVAAAQ